MRSNVRNRPVQHKAEETCVLQNQFFSFHMVDTASPPTYEAILFIGIDSSNNQFVVHWLDVFGGAGARVVALGPISPETIAVVYPYAEGRFRNIFTYVRQNDEWTLFIEAEDATNRWSPFAQYTISRK